MTEAQARAVQYVRTEALEVQCLSHSVIDRILAGEGLSAIDVDLLIDHIRRFARVTLNFHPDRLLVTGRSVVEGLFQDGVYRGQFETSISNGSRTAFAGGDRDRWEEHLFGKSYQAPGVTKEERPKYGGLNLMNYADGASPRFGSCHLVLRPHVSERCTFTFGDSFTGPERKGTIDVFSPLLASLFETAVSTQEVLGSDHISAALLVELLQKLNSRSKEFIPEAMGRSLDDYIEAQVHAVVDLANDAEALIADPSFRGTPTGNLLEETCYKYGLRLGWHAGYQLEAESVPSDFRGPAMQPLARRIDQRFGNEKGRIDAAVLGLAAASLHNQPEAWQDWGSYDETLQHIKQLWHVLVRFGAPNSCVT
ncbi:hypothetical protein FHS19_006143 [Paenibacillus rhizosphaerae]|uniref:DUF3626 domain-containing protein n=1 Tax=Paenibacillus rhizosphaerae TaxID=297318 RepID=A0A839TY67_9BACL|nr:DUF3626 domain-containing protein [Paenibacillus rhizosphaerae]MBB3131423.1 hypothetical protein [Paenibacillus rhizosphaerae]